MDRTISAAEANRSFSRLLRAVREGDSFTVTSHGQPVARIVPCGAAEDGAVIERRRQAMRALIEELRTRPVAADRPRSWTRGELYQRD